MPEASVGAPALIEWGVASLALPGEAESGDRHLVKPVGTGVLVAVVDGLGHGAEAASAAKAAVAALERHATESPAPLLEIGRAPCRERVWVAGGARWLEAERTGGCRRGGQVGGRSGLAPLLPA